jgi:opacity protein-like surface antigen
MQQHMEMIAMKKLLMGAAFAAMLASPALAQSSGSQFGSGDAVRLSGGSAYTTEMSAAESTIALRDIRAQAWEPDTEYYIGRDPDPNVQLQLLRDRDGHNY